MNLRATLSVKKLHRYYIKFSELVECALTLFPYNVTRKSNVKVTKVKKLLIVKQIPLPEPYEIYEEQFGENT